jgi:hypothetical protein
MVRSVVEGMLSKAVAAQIQRLRRRLLPSGSNASAQKAWMVCGIVRHGPN